jgi:hypothetical protein
MYIAISSSAQRGADPAGVERQRNPSRRPAHGWAFFLFIKLAKFCLVELGQYQQFETFVVSAVYNLCNVRLNFYLGKQDKVALLFFLSWMSESRIDF